MKDMKEIRNKSKKDLEDFVKSEREALRSERFKDKMSRKASTIRSAKRNVARALTELTHRRDNPENN